MSRFLAVKQAFVGTVYLESQVVGQQFYFCRIQDHFRHGASSERAG
jgi:hypothetical protein